MKSTKALIAISVFFALLSIGGIIYFVILSGSRNMSQLEATLFSVVLLILEVALGFSIGVWSARDAAYKEYQPFVRSALRRTYGLVEGLGRVQDSIREGIRRMSTRASISSSARAQMWGELMNLIYSQMNELLRQSESSIEDWREFGPEEIQRLEQSQRLKEERIRELTERLRELYELIGDLSGAPAVVTTGAMDRLETVASSLQRELEGLRGRSILPPIDLGTVQKGEVRKLLLSGAFEEAIGTYSQLIDLHPTNHSLYIGRARAKYLAGDKNGALADLDLAEELLPGDSVVRRAREQIALGRWFPVAVSSGVPQNLAKAFEGNEALAGGRVDEARRLFEEAKELGLNIAFACTNLAMVGVAARDPQAALENLNGFNHLIAGPYMRVQVEALKALCTAVEGDEPDLIPLREALDQCSEFVISKSPLRFCEAGLKTLGISDEHMEIVFAQLR